jgi:hypothetical protein
MDGCFFIRKRLAKAVLTEATGYSVGRATRQGSSSVNRPVCDHISHVRQGVVNSVAAYTGRS